VINVWRSITKQPVATNPLACCSTSSLHPEDLVVFEIHYADRIGENYFAKWSERHRWYYFPHMTHDEVILLKTFDSHGTMVRDIQQKEQVGKDYISSMTLHTAFIDPSSPPDAPDRESIEVRCIVLWGE
jgi:hypothetical protein